MPELQRSFKVKFNDFMKAGDVSIQIQSILKTIGFDPDLIRRVSVCAYESEMNVVMHGGDGDVSLIVGPKDQKISQSMSEMMAPALKTLNRPFKRDILRQHMSTGKWGLEQVWAFQI